VNPHLVAISGDVKNSTFSEVFQDAYPDHFYQGYIAEQNLVSAGVGLAARGKVPFLDTFACFFARALRPGENGRDQPEQYQPLRVTLRSLDRRGWTFTDGIGGYCDIPRGSFFGGILPERCGIGGASRGGHGSAAWKQLPASRPKMPVLYGKDERFPVPGFKVLRKSDLDKATIIGAGVTLHEALKAADQLKSTGTAVRVIDLYCVKPLDGKALAAEIAATGGRLVTVEDHWAEGGIGEAVLAALAQANAAPSRSRLLAVRNMPHSGKPDELIDAFGISAKHVVDAINAIS
jgi:transketolase